jgi:methyl-accepting chemotaxis protein
MLLSRKLPLAAALMTLISVGVASVAAIWLASISLETAAYEKLDAVADGRRDQIEIHLKNIEKDLVAVSRREDVAQATNLFASAWSEIGKDQKSELQKRYIKDNPNPLGEKHLLNKANANDAYDVVHEKYHPRFRELLEAGAYYDIFIISPEGDIIYSVFKELDYATNLNSGEWKDTDLAKLYKDVMKSGNASDVVFEDYHPYGPSNGAAASFIGKVIVENGQKIGVLAFQMPTQSIADIVHNRTGLGETGETLLLNKEGYLIIDSKFSETDDSLKTKIDYPGIQSISHDEITNGFIDTYRDMYAEIALVKVDFNDANWVVAAILEQDEALAGITTMRNSVIVAALVLVLGTLAIALWFSRTITKPIDGLVHNMTELANGNTDIKLADKANEKTSLEEKSEALRQENENEATKRSNERERETQKIQSAVSALAQGLDRLAIGDLTTSIDNKFDGELDSLRVNFNKSVAQLRKTLQRISQSTVSIDDNSREMKIAADDLARRTEQQAASLEQTSAALEEITSTVKEASDQTKDAAKMANAAMEDTNKSSAVVNDAVMAMGGIESASSEIANIINVIDEIAFQTNLLALNAGVEAARAGEAGKGFAVVAQEVRELAGRSAEAAKDIKGLIAKSTAEVNNGVCLVKATGDALASISKHVSKITGTIGSIANASTEQLTAITEVNTAIGQMDQVTQQNAAMVEESTAVTHKMAEDAEMLATAVNEFQIEANQTHDYSKVA